MKMVAFLRDGFDTGNNDAQRRGRRALSIKELARKLGIREEMVSALEILNFMDEDLQKQIEEYILERGFLKITLGEDESFLGAGK